MFRRVSLRFFRWVAALFSYKLVASADVEAAINECRHLVDYTNRSAALSHPRRVNARARVLEATAAICNHLTLM